MHTLRHHSRLLLLPLALLSAGCASTGSFGRSAEDKNLKTIASIGDQPISSSTGSRTKSSAVAELGEPSRRSDENLVSGRVIDDLGKPVPNAKVRVADGGIAGGRVVSARADRTGAFTLHGLRPGSSYTLIAEYEGRDGAFEGRSEVRAPEENVEIALESVDDPVDRRRASKPAAGRTVSERQEVDENDERDLDAKPIRLNREDVPSSNSDVEDIDDLSNQTSSTTRKRSGASAIPVSGWRRIAPESGTDKVASADPSSEGTSDRATKRASTRVAPPDPEPEDDTRSTRARRRQDVDDDLGLPAPAAKTVDAEDDENPLPPAIHPDAPRSRGASADDDDLPPPRSRPAKRVSQSDSKKSPGSKPGAFVLAKDEILRERVAPRTQAARPSVQEDPEPVVPQTRERDLIDQLPLAQQAPQERPRDLIDQLPADFMTTSPRTVASPPSQPRQEQMAESDEETDPFAAPAERSIEPAKPRRKATWGEMEGAWKGTQRPAVSTAAPTRNEYAEPPVNRSATLPAMDHSKKNIEACRYDRKQRQILNFRLPDLNGKPVTLDNFDSDLIVLDFWGTWCRPCLNSVPHMIELQERLGGKNLTVVGIACESGPAITNAIHVRDVAERMGINYPILLSSKDEFSPLQDELNVSAFPTIIVIDKKGHVVWRETGATEAILARLDRAVDPALRANTSRR